MPSYTKRPLYYGWLPQSPDVHAQFLRTHVSRHAPNAPVLAPPPVAATPDLGKLVDDFFKAINDSEDMKSRFDLIFRQVNKDEKWAPKEEDFRVHDLDHLKKALTSVVSGPPKVHVITDDKGNDIGEPIGIPIYLVLDLLINTDAAHDLFRMEEFNKPMKALLDGWGAYLMDKTSDSNRTLGLDKEGWLGEHGLAVLQQGLKGLSFEHTYGVKPEKAKDSYKSWDDFFIRSIKDFDRLRPIVAPDLYAAVHNACESTTLRTAHDVKLDDTFWLKSQEYSLWDMLGGKGKNSLADKYAKRFEHGSIYQAFLAPQDYHHWHSPIDANVIDTAVLPGTYYAAVPDDGAPENDGHIRKGDPHGALMRSQPWLSVAAARGVIILEPQDKNSPIDLVGFIGIGMVEVSTIDLRVSKDNTQGPSQVKAGGHLGMFHFGGSSYTLIVKPKDGYEVKFLDEDDHPVAPKEHRWVNSIIGRVVKKGVV